MRSLSIWVCCLALIGCEAKIEVKVEPRASKVTVTKRDGYVELKSDKLSARVVVVETRPPLTVTVSEDEETSETYIAWTEHTCETSVSTIKYFAVYDRDANLIQEDRDVDLVVDADPGSMGEAELALACPKGKSYV